MAPIRTRTALATRIDALRNAGVRWLDIAAALDTDVRRCIEVWSVWTGRDV